VEIKMSEKEKDSNELLNILMIILGIIFILKAVFEFLAWGGIYVPSWLSDWATNPDAEAALAILGGQGIISAVLGFWCLIAGIRMFAEEEWALGAALVVLSIMALMGVSAIIRWITVPGVFDITYWPNWVTIAATIIGGIGFFWLLFTRKRYD